MLTSAIGPISINSGSGITTTGDLISIDRNLIEYIDLLYQLLGVDMTYDKFKNLSTSEKQTFIRDIKIKLLLQNDILENQ